MTSALNDPSLDQICRSARTPNGWADRPVEDDTVREIYDLMKWGPTSANSSPARFVWVRRPVAGPNHGVDRTRSDPRNGEVFMSTQENVQTVKDFFAALASGDKQRLLSLVVKDIE